MNEEILKELKVIEELLRDLICMYADDHGWKLKAQQEKEYVDDE